MALYRVRVWAGDLFRYPSFSGSADARYEEYWEKRRGSTLGTLSEWQRDRERLVLSCIPDARPARLADIGCGDGAFVAHIARSLGSPHTAGYDFSPQALEEARRNGVDTVVALDITDPEARSQIQKADYVFLFEVLEHVPDAEDLLAHAYACASSGVFFSVPNTGFMTHRLRLLLGRFPLQWALRPGEHVRFWTYIDMRWWLGSLGYTNARILPYRGVPVLRTLLPNLFAEGLLVYIKRP